MYQEVTKSMFRDEFSRCGRGEQFSYKALGHLYDYFIEYEESSGDDFELDVIALCCEYAEEEIDNVLSDYGLSNLDQLKDRTTVIWHDETRVLYQQF